MAECEDSQGSPDLYVFLGKRVYGTWVLALVLLACASTVPALLSANLWVSSVVMVVVVAVLVVICAAFMVSRSMVTPRAPRVAAVACAAASFVIALFGTVSVHADAGVVGAQDAGSSGSILWISATIGTLVILLIVGFGFEMARRVRARLIESLSIVVSAGVAGWCAGGWVFLPSLITHGTITTIITCLILVVVSGALCSVIPWLAHRLRKTKDSAASRSNDEKMSGGGGTPPLTTASSSQDARKLSVALGILPIILSGALIPLTLVAQSLIV